MQKLKLGEVFKALLENNQKIAHKKKVLALKEQVPLIQQNCLDNYTTSTSSACGPFCPLPALNKTLAPSVNVLKPEP